MTVLLVANHLNPGGVTSYLLTLSRGLLARGHRVLLFSSGGERLDEFLSLGVRLISAGFRMKNELHPGLFLSIPRLLRIVRQEGVGLLHAHTRAGQMLSALVSFFSDIPFISTCHGFFTPHWGRWLFPLWGDRVIAISPQVAWHLTEDLRIPVSRVVTVPNGIDGERFQPLPAEAREALKARWGFSSRSLLGTVARLSPVKGLHVLLKALPKVLSDVPEAACVMIGKGPSGRILKKMVSDLGLEGRVVFLEDVPHIEEAMASLDVCVVPSIQEGMGLAAMEAGACGVPVVASRVGGLPSVVDHGRTGLLVPANDPETLAEAITELLGSPQQRVTMGARARQHILSRFSSQDMVDGTLKAYRSVTEEEK
ncbi:MAG: glycosyltransferase family 4 protein [Elusimicrobia bacterium]|nr:glycosyltransferase family 4 protein [Elusimicrobiota bacterium]